MFYHHSSVLHKKYMRPCEWNECRQMCDRCCGHRRSEVTVWTLRETELKIDHNHVKIMDLGGC